MSEERAVRPAAKMRQGATQRRVQLPLCLAGGAAGARRA